MERTIIWDDRKRQATLDKRGLDFAEVSLSFFDEAAIIPSRGRFKAIGWLADRPVTVVFAPLGTQGLTIISMRVASVKERKLLHG